jgi:hypothetical protein
MKKLRPKTIEGLIEKIQSEISVDEKECHNWTGLKNKRGYGKIRFKNKHYRAHRLSYEVFMGAIADGLYVCHTCDNPSCVNPKHLFLGTDMDNKKDMVKKNRQNNQYTIKDHANETRR